MKRRKISIKLIGTIVPIVIIALVIVTVVSATTARTIVNSQISKRMEAELTTQENAIEKYMDGVSSMATTISRVVEESYKTTSWDVYEKMLGKIVNDNELVLGSGLWFEPYVMDAKQEYYGPYVYKDGGSLVTTWDYSNAEYDYFNQEYYMNAKTSDHAVFTDPYFDESSGIVMSSCSMPIIVDGNYIGCVTVDIKLDTITQLVNDIKIDKTGKAMMVDAKGIYMAGVDQEKIAKAENIQDDPVKSVAQAGKEMLAKGSGETKATFNGKDVNMYYGTVSATNWILALDITQEELNQPIKKLTMQLVLIAILSVLLVTFIIIIQVQAIAKGIVRVERFARKLAEGDFTVDRVTVKSKDEVGAMGDSLNDMYDSNKKIITSISEHSVELDEASSQLRQASDELMHQFGEIKEFMSHVNEAMMTSSAATEQVNASTEEVLVNTDSLAEETEDSKRMAKEIRGRATEVQNSSRQAYESASELGQKFEKNLYQSIENAKVVQSISELANVISGIAEEINLLSLNASIEAARAGEAGRGFAVVATEIGQLAGSTGEAVNKIQATIHEVQVAFDILSKDARDMLGFLTDKVTPDYRNFVEVAEQYGKDAETIDHSAAKISGMAENIRGIIGEVSDAITNIAEATQDTTNLSNNIMEGIENVSEKAENVAEMSGKQQDIAEELNTVVSQFHL
ncbi:MAG: methyl-accepting chemotaxis protein [Lachnospiraceae bacterium]|jgi:methyl-accepting chemotaxis protein|nr:methyl-accepting chemotaxis protein [Lachnospiraceae bacterium]